MAELGACVTATTTHHSHAAVLEGVLGCVRVVEADLRQRASLEKLVAGAAYLFNFAGVSGAVESGQSPGRDLEINGMGALNVLEACRQFNPDVRILFPGSRLQYGRPRYLPVDEDHPMEPISIYGIHKLLGEKYHLLYHRNYGLRTTVLRISNVYGPDGAGMGRRSYNVVNQFARLALAGETLPVFGDGHQLRDYIYVRDLAEVVLRVSQAEHMVGRVYNVGSGCPVRFVDMVRMIIEKAGQGQIEYRPWPSEASLVETGDFYLSIDFLTKALGWYPAYTLERGIAETVDALRDSEFKVQGNELESELEIVPHIG